MIIIIEHIVYVFYDPNLNCLAFSAAQNCQGFINKFHTVGLKNDAKQKTAKSIDVNVNLWISIFKCYVSRH